MNPAAPRFDMAEESERLKLSPEFRAVMRSFSPGPRATKAITKRAGFHSRRGLYEGVRLIALLTTTVIAVRLS
jgi:hypothetical protein